MKNLYNDIIIATDGTTYVEKAIDDALDLAELTGATIHAIYVTDVSSVSPTSSDWEIVSQKIKKEASDAMEYIREESKKRDIKLKEVIVEGNPANEILKYSSLINADLIVVGATGKKTLERLVLGSVSEKVVRSSKTKVLVVKLKTE